MTDDWVGFCTKKLLFGSNRKASSQIKSSRSFRPLRPRSKTSHSRLDWPNPRAPLLSRCVACCGASGRLPVFSNLAVLIFRRVCEGSPSLLVVLIRQNPDQLLMGAWFVAVAAELIPPQQGLTGPFCARSRGERRCHCASRIWPLSRATASPSLSLPKPIHSRRQY